MIQLHSATWNNYAHLNEHTTVTLTWDKEIHGSSVLLSWLQYRLTSMTVAD